MLRCSSSLAGRGGCGGISSDVSPGRCFLVRKKEGSHGLCCRARGERKPGRREGANAGEGHGEFFLSPCEEDKTMKDQTLSCNEAGRHRFFLPASTLCSFMPPRDAIRNLRTFEEARSELMREEGSRDR